METLTRIRSTRAVVDGWHRQGQRIALVPTMGNLHAGHLALVEEARRRGDRVVATIFVNPLQFGPQEDFAAYPRTLAEDQRRLSGAGVDLLFAPEVEEMYPRGSAEPSRVEVPALASTLCGASRSGHFTGVATVVAKLFNIIQPEVALFGEKDYQQLLVIRRLTADLCFPVEVVGVPTVRESDGLAMSSRNAYLNSVERRQAPELYRSLCAAADALRAGRPAGRVERETEAALQGAGFRLDYVAVRRANDLGPVSEAGGERVILAAAWLGRARLIDNLRVRCGGAGTQ